LRLLTAEGKELARSDDAEGCGGDSRFTHLFEGEGDYLLAVTDVRHAGGSDYRYRLRIGSFPMVSAVYPAGGRSGEVMSFELTGDDRAASTTVNVGLPEVRNAAQLTSFSVPSDHEKGSGWFQVEVGCRNESLEKEPNDAPADATTAQLSGFLNGRLDKPDDRDCFKFQGHKGQRLHLVALTRELGSSCDLHMSLLKADGSRLAVARQELQTTLDAELPADGEYTVQIENLAIGDSKPGLVYRVEADGDYPGFALRAEHCEYNAPQGGTFVVKVFAERRGYGGPIELEVEGLGDDIKLEGNVFDGGETLLKITLPRSIAQGELRQAAIVGRAKGAETHFMVRADQREALRGQFANILAFPTALEDQIAIGIGPPFPPFFELGVASPTLYFPQLVGQSTFDVSVTRKNDAFKDAVAITVEGLPKGVTAEAAPVDDGAKAMRITLKGPADLPEGEFPVRIVGTGKFQEQTQSVAVGNLKLQSVKPLVVTIAPLGPITAGGHQQAEIQVQRFGDQPQPVRLQFRDGPAGLSAPIAITLPPDATKTTIPLAAAADAPPGKFDNLVLVASTTVKGQDITVQSQPAGVEILPAAAVKPPEGPR
jgi:hypothetical protein